MAISLQNFNTEDFLARFWQREPLYIPQALPGFIDPLDADELAGLAMEEDVESRLITRLADTEWQLEHGPFEEKRLRQLAGEFSLLVQATDHFEPTSRDLLTAFNFLPSWLIDDVMASFAPTGGGTGPHYDRYDVFLVQGSGSRRWRLGQRCEDSSTLLPHDELKILAEFQCTEEYILEPGDILYVPPGVAHWGESLSNAMTWSIGFRAPSHGDMLSTYCDFLIDHALENEQLLDITRTSRTNPHEITTEDIDAVHAELLKLVDRRDLITQWYGRHVSTPKYGALEEVEVESSHPLTADNIAAITWHRNPASRLAFIELDNSLLLFFDGQHRELPIELAPLVKLLCAEDQINGEDLVAYLEWEDGQNLLLTLIVQEVLFNA